MQGSASLACKLIAWCQSRQQILCIVDGSGKLGMLKQIWGWCLQMNDAHVSGANLLQVTWEHMTLLPAHALGILRDSLLKCLGQHWRWTHPVRETEDRFLPPLVSSSCPVNCLCACAPWPAEAAD